MDSTSSGSQSSQDKKRCWWCGNDPLYIEYHDREWGRPLHDDNAIFEMLILEGFQAGLSWLTVLRKRGNFREAFRGFDPVKVSRLSETYVEQLMDNEGIIRNRAKIQAAITNAKAFLSVQKEFDTFDRYIWSFTNYKTLRSPKPVTPTTMRTTSPESEALSKDLKKRGFTFVGPTIMYAHMQATGMIDDHAEGCFRQAKSSADIEMFKGLCRKGKDF